LINHKKNTRLLAAETCAVILAAGLGSRLGPNTKECPKCLVHVSGTPILERMIDTLASQGVTRIIIAVGYLADQIRKFVLSRYPGLDIRFVENPQYASTGSVFSLDLALDVVVPDLNILLVEGDVVLDSALMARTLQVAEYAPDAATLLAPYEPSLSGTFALVNGGIVSAWTHESVRANDFPLVSSFKTVNITFVLKGAPLTALCEEVKSTISNLGRRAPLEYAMQGLVTKGMQIVAVETTGLKWFEVDTPEDLAIAENLFGPVSGDQSAGASELPASL
jgi:Predicted sugar nucleotidyltransferases